MDISQYRTAQHQCVAPHRVASCRVTSRHFTSDQIISHHIKHICIYTKYLYGMI